MIINFIDDVIRRGKYDLIASSENDIDFVEFKGFKNIKKKIKGIEKELKVVEWKSFASCTVPANQFYYNDAVDTTVRTIKSWTKFYKKGKDLVPESELYFGGEHMMKKEGICFTGFAKVTAYLRYSDGFNKWLKDKDAKVAHLLAEENKLFQDVFVNGKLDGSSWFDKFKPRKWTIPAVTRLSDGTLIVLGLMDGDKTVLNVLEKIGINVKYSLELMKMFNFQDVSEDGNKSKGNGIVDVKIQVASGNGRNAFGREYKVKELYGLPDSEYVKLLGYKPEASRDEIVHVFSNLLRYKVETSPNPKGSELIFFPKGELKYSGAKMWLDRENQRKYSKKKKTKANEDVENIIVDAPNHIPSHSLATVLLINEDGRNKKTIVQQVFPSVSLEYLSMINRELLVSKTTWLIIEYMKSAICRKSEATPSVYQYWTRILTSLLSLDYVYGNEAYNCFQRYCTAYTCKELIEDRKINEYFRLTGKLLRLQHIVHTAKNEPERLYTVEFNSELEGIEKGRNIKKGIFDMVIEKKSPLELVGEVYNVLRLKEKEKLDAFIEQASSRVPAKDFDKFVRGALVGMQLNTMSWILKQEKRKFLMTQGRHPTTLRGDIIENIFCKGFGLLININKQNCFNGNVLPFIKSCAEESKKDTFNSGLIMGMGFYVKNDDIKENEENKQKEEK